MEKVQEVTTLLSEESISRIDLLYEVAKLNDSALSLGDLLVLLRTENTVADLEEAFSRSPSLRERYQLRSGYVFERGLESAVSSELAKKSRALHNIILAVNLGWQLRRSGGEVVAVSGSTSYESARDSDDLDFFCITESGSAWIFITKALALLRVSGLGHRGGSRVCLSCVMDLDYARRAFGTERDPLFARDALNAIVLEGNAEYTDLLRRARWMQALFPRLYEIRSGPYSKTRANPISTAKRVLNLFLFQTVGRYIKVKSTLENRRVARFGDKSRQFVAKTGDDHSIYESERYRRMREVYSRISR